MAIAASGSYMGRKAAQIMLELINSENGNTPMHYVLPTDLVVRQSTRPLLLP